jgi:phosphotransferase system  glucose/maltose/N-acetylglucosamine-specific IIC component
MHSVSLVLMVLALVCALLAAVRWPPVAVDLGWLGFAFFVAAQLVR